MVFCWRFSREQILSLFTKKKTVQAKVWMIFYTHLKKYFCYKHYFHGWKKIMTRNPNINWWLCWGWRWLSEKVSFLIIWIELNRNEFSAIDISTLFFCSMHWSHLMIRYVVHIHIFWWKMYGTMSSIKRKFFLWFFFFVLGIILIRIIF